MEVYVTPHLTVPEWARKAGHLLLVASLSPAGPLPLAVAECWAREWEVADHPMWASAHIVASMREGVTWNLAVFDLIAAGVGADAIPNIEEVIPYLGRGQLG